MRGAFTALSFAIACTAVPAAAQETVNDPWEGFNRDMFAVHDTIDRAVLEPVARGYRAVAPEPVRTGVRQFLRNLRGPVIFANDLLQGEPTRAGVTAARFGVNTTIGVFGIFDPATTMGLDRHDEDFGQTLAVWGVGSGPYLFLPVLGPTNVRDSAGRIVDAAFDPLTWAEFDDVETARTARGVATGVSAREAVIEAVEDVRATSIDPYATIRTSYDLLRQSAIANGQTNVQDLPDFDDSLEMPGDLADEPMGPPGEEIPQQPQPDTPASSMTGLEGVASMPTSLAQGEFQ